MSDIRDRYAQIAADHTEAELVDILGVHPRSIRRYAQHTGIRPKVTRYRNRSLEEWAELFEQTYRDRLTVSDLTRDDQGRPSGLVKCTSCGAHWTARLSDKLASLSGCVVCDKGNHGNAYSAEEVEALLNEQHADQWELISYEKYSSGRSTIRCTLCGVVRQVVLSDMINTTSRRCTNCQTGSFGEYVIRNTLNFNEIPFETEVPLKLKGCNYRLDFLIAGKIALEYSGAQHFEEGLYYNESITRGVVLKRQWALEKGYEFHEIVANKTMRMIIRDLAATLNRTLRTPPAAYFANNDEAMATVLAYMQTHSARQTSRDLKVSIPKIRKYVQLAGYESITAWQAEHQKTHP